MAKVIKKEKVITKLLLLLLSFSTLSILLIFFNITCIPNISAAKYQEYLSYNIFNINLDTKKPYFSINNIHINDESNIFNINSNHILKFDVTLYENNINLNNFNESNIKLFLNNRSTYFEILDFKIIEEFDSGKKYNIAISNISNNGILSISIDDNIVSDSHNNFNNYTSLSTNIIVDNISPNVIFIEKQSNPNSLTGTLISNEPLQPINGWTSNDDYTRFEKEFYNNISLSLDLYDISNNSTNLQINITSLI